jgi:hypothetical protein
MMTPNDLTERLAAWSAKFRERSAVPESSPIRLYQLLFGLLHDLKSSVQISEDAQIKNLIETVLKSENLLRELAYDQGELDTAANANLHKLASNLSDLESIEVFLANTPRRVPVRIDLPLLKRPFSWEGLSRGRATSCARHGYHFYETLTMLPLAELTRYDETLQYTLGPLGGIDIVRQLTPHSEKIAGSTKTVLNLELLQVISLPRTVSRSAIEKRWKMLS